MVEVAINRPIPKDIIAIYSMLCFAHSLGFDSMRTIGLLEVEGADCARASR
jgi:hypothetical protein